MTDCQSTHAPSCWSWGPRHYECAVGQVKRDEALLRQALEALEFEADGWEYPPPKTTAAITALREALAEPEPRNQCGETCERAKLCANTSGAVALVRNAALDEAIKIIEEYRIPVGNSAAGELACEWTRDALEEIRDMLRAMKEQA